MLKTFCDDLSSGDAGRSPKQDGFLLHVRRQHGGGRREGRDQEEVPEPFREEEEGPVQHVDHRAGLHGQPEQPEDGQDHGPENHHFISEAA